MGTLVTIIMWSSCGTLTITTQLSFTTTDDDRSGAPKKSPRTAGACWAALMVGGIALIARGFNSGQQCHRLQALVIEA
jgi:hypothetical protein